MIWLLGKPIFGPFPRLFRVLNKHNFPLYRSSDMLVSLPISPPIRFVLIWRRLVPVKVVFLATYFCAKLIQNRIDLLLFIDQSMPTIEKSLTNQRPVYVSLFGLGALLYERYDPMYFSLRKLVFDPFFSLVEYNHSDFFCSIEFMVFVASWSIIFLI